MRSNNSRRSSSFSLVIHSTKDPQFTCLDAQTIGILNRGGWEDQKGTKGLGIRTRYTDQGMGKETKIVRLLRLLQEINRQPVQSRPVVKSSGLMRYVQIRSCTTTRALPLLLLLLPPLLLPLLLLLSWQKKKYGVVLCKPHGEYGEYGVCMYLSCILPGALGLGLGLGLRLGLERDQGSRYR